jgi:hypothetical protein
MTMKLLSGKGSTTFFLFGITRNLFLSFLITCVDPNICISLCLFLKAVS